MILFHISSSQYLAFKVSCVVSTIELQHRSKVPSRRRYSGVNKRNKSAEPSFRGIAMTSGLRKVSIIIEQNFIKFNNRHFYSRSQRPPTKPMARIFGQRLKRQTPVRAFINACVSGCNAPGFGRTTNNFRSLIFLVQNRLQYHKPQRRLSSRSIPSSFAACNASL